MDILGTKGAEQYIFNNGLNRIKKEIQRPNIMGNGSCFGFKDVQWDFWTVIVGWSKNGEK